MRERRLYYHVRVTPRHARLVLILFDSIIDYIHVGTKQKTDDKYATFFRNQSTDSKKSATSSNSSAHAECAMPVYVLKSALTPLDVNTSLDIFP